MVAEIKQSFIDGDEQAVKAERPHGGKKSTGEVSDSSEKAGICVVTDASAANVEAMRTESGKNPSHQVTTKKNMDVQKGSTEIENENERKQSDYRKAEEKESK